MDYKHGMVETQRHSLLLVVSPLVSLMVDQGLMEKQDLDTDTDICALSLSLFCQISLMW